MPPLWRLDHAGLAGPAVKAADLAGGRRAVDCCSDHHDGVLNIAGTEASPTVEGAISYQRVLYNGKLARLLRAEVCGNVGSMTRPTLDS